MQPFQKTVKAKIKTMNNFKYSTTNQIKKILLKKFLKT